jgi:glutathione peroxidase
MGSSILEIPVRRISGANESLAHYQGRVVLIVNVASKCGLTPQYEGLEELYRKYRDRGLVVLGFPANDFAGQEPGTNEEIAAFCSSTFAVDFPLFEKISVTGSTAHPLYQALIHAQPKATSTSDVPFSEHLKEYGISPNAEPEVLWNFEKFLVDRSGEVVARFSPDMTPDDPVLTAAIETELAKN